MTSDSGPPARRGVARHRGAWCALLRLVLGHSVHRPLQSALLVFGIALGVAVGVAIDLANSSALSAFELSTEAVAGRATHRVVGGPRGLDEEVYVDLRTELGLRAAAPIVQGTVAVGQLDGEQLTLLGVDPLAESPFRAYLSAGGGLQYDALAALFVVPGSLLISEDLARRAGVSVGDHLELDLGARAASAPIAGILEPADGLSRRALETLLIADLSSAQELLDRTGSLDRIDLLLQEDASFPGASPLAGRTRSADTSSGDDALRERIEELLPPGASIVPANEQGNTLAQMTDAFRLNLSALSLLALLVGMFLVFNTVRFSIVQRRRTLATLRAIGVTQREIFGMIAVETAMLGALGSLVGIALGLVLGRGAVVLVSRTINDLYFVSTVRGVDVPIGTIVRGAFLGTGAALVAALLPAREATKVAPVAALRRSDVERDVLVSVPRLAAAGIGIAALGIAALVLPGNRIDVGFAALAVLVLGFALVAPAWTLFLMSACRPVLGRAFGTVGRLAPRDIVRALSRTAVAVAALMVAVCVSIGVEVMVDSFRATVEEWLAVTLQADIFISARSVSAAGAPSPLDPALVGELAELPEVAALSTAAGGTVRSSALGAVRVVAVSTDLAGSDRRFVEAIGTTDDVREALLDGAVMISEPFARKHGLRVTGSLPLVTDRGERRFPIAAVYYDYTSSEGVAFMADPTYRRFWDDESISSIALVLAGGAEADVDATVAKLRRMYAGRQELNIRSNRGLRQEVMAIFDRAFAITAALRLLAIAVAFIGVLSTLMALQLERSREYATLRATGMTKGQLGGLAMLETALLGAAAGLLSWPAGLSLALVLIYVINRRSFGWTIDTTLHPGAFATALGLAIAAAVLAGAYPAMRLGRLPIARALREE